MLERERNTHFFISTIPDRRHLGTPLTPELPDPDPVDLLGLAVDVGGSRRSVVPRGPGVRDTQVEFSLSPSVPGGDDGRT